MIVKITTDGSSLGNPGPSGAGIVLEGGELRKEFSKELGEGSNIRAEMLAAIMGLEHVKPGYTCLLRTDSKHVVDGFVKWLPGWKQRGWRTSKRRPVKHRKLWERLEKAVARQERVTFVYVPRGSTPAQVRADKLAQDGAFQVEAHMAEQLQDALASLR